MDILALGVTPFDYGVITEDADYIYTPNGTYLKSASPGWVIYYGLEFPSDFAQYTYIIVDGVWVLNLPPLTNAEKEAKLLEINAWRAAANQSTFTYDGNTYACDSLSRSDIDATANCLILTGGFPPGYTGSWKTSANTYVTINTREVFNDFYAAMAAQGMANFKRSEELKWKTTHAANIKELDELVW